MKHLEKTAAGCVRGVGLGSTVGNRGLSSSNGNKVFREEQIKKKEKPNTLKRGVTIEDGTKDKTRGEPRLHDSGKRSECRQRLSQRVLALGSRDSFLWASRLRSELDSLGQQGKSKTRRKKKGAPKESYNTLNVV